MYDQNFAQRPIATFSNSRVITDTVRGLMYQIIDGNIVATTLEYFESFESFINNGKSKIIKDTIGNVRTVVTTTPRITTDNRLSDTYNGATIQPVSIEFDWTEVRE